MFDFIVPPVLTLNLNVSVAGISQQLEAIRMTLQDILDKVTAQTTVVQSVVTLLQTLHQELVDALAANDPAKVQAAVDAIGANTDALAQAVTANT